MAEAKIPKKVYHGSSHKITGSLLPVLKKDYSEAIHTKAAVFATEREDIAALFMFPENLLASICFEQDIAFICIWGTPESLVDRKIKGFMYVFLSESFEQVGKEYEWQSFKQVWPVVVKKFDSVIDGMIECGVQVYFINDDPTFDLIVKNKGSRAPIVKNLLSENQKRKLNIRNF